MTRLRDLGLSIGQLPPGPAQRDHRRRRRARRHDDAHRRRRAARGRAGPHPHRRHRRRAAPGHRRAPRVRRDPHAERQRRDDGPGVDPRVGPPHDARSASRTRTASAWSATPSSRPRSRARDARSSFWALPVAAETYDGALNDINGMHVRPEHVQAALDAAADGPVPEGSVGGGTGMICHEFKGGTGTASRVVPAGWTVGALVQANHGDREHLMIDGVPVGRELPAIRDPVGVGRGGGGPARRRGVDHRDRRDGRAAPAAPARPARAARGPRDRARRAAPAVTRAATSSSPSPPATPSACAPTSSRARARPSRSRCSPTAASPSCSGA